MRDRAGPGERLRTRGLLQRCPGLARLAVADAVGPFGDAMATTALILHLQRTAGTGTAVAAVLVAEAVPPMLSPFTGAIADRARDRRRLVSACLVAQAVVVGIVAVTLPPIVPLAALVLVRATFDAVAAPALGAALPALVDDRDLPAANGLLGGARELGFVLGPPVAGLVFAAAGARAALAVDALTFLVVVPLLPSLAAAGARTDDVPPVVTPGGARATTWRADAREGLAFVWRTPAVRAVALGFWLFVLANAADDLVLAFLAAGPLGASPGGVGVLLGAASLGLLLCLPIVPRAARRRSPQALVLLGFAVAATGNLLTAVAPTLAAAVAAQVVRGAGIPLADVSVRTQLQREAPPGLVGRALANVYGGVSVMAAFGYAIGGPFLDATSPRAAMTAVGVAGLTATAVAAALLARRR